MEVIIGTVILLLILLPAIASVSQSLRVVDKARDVTLSSSMMQSVIEQLRMQTFAVTKTTYCGTSPTVGTTYTDTTSTTGSKLRALIQNQELFNSNNSKQFTMKGDFKLVATGQIELTLSTSWKDMDGRAQSHRMFTVISEGGLSDNVNKGW